MVGALSAVALVALVLFLMLRNRRLKKSGHLTQRLLEDRDAELVQLNAVWLVPYSALEVAHKLGAGANGVVLSAVWRKEGAGEAGLRVAVKMLGAEVMQAGALEASTSYDSPAVELAREIDFLQRTLHPNIVRFFGAGQRVSGEAFVVVEYVELGDLTGLVRDRAKGLKEAVKKYRSGEFFVALGLGVRGARPKRIVTVASVPEVESSASNPSSLPSPASSVAEMKLSLLRDTVQGMYYIHDLGHLHR